MSNEIIFFCFLFLQNVTCDLQSTTCKTITQIHIVHHVDACEVWGGEYKGVLPIPYTFFYSNCNKNDAPSNSLKDSNANPKMKTIEEEKIGVHFLVRNTLGVRGACWSSKMGIRMRDKRVIIHMDLQKLVG